MVLDIRTKLVITLLTATCVSLNNDISIETGMMLVLSFLLIVCTRSVKDLRLLCLYFLLTAVEFVLFPAVPSAVAMVLSLPVVNIRGFFPVILCIVLLCKTTKVSQIMAVFTRMHVPKQLVITFAVAVRYLPALAEEWRHISDAMKVRRVTITN